MKLRQFPSPSSRVSHCTHSNGTSYRNQFHPDPAHKLSANWYDIYHCCAYSEKLLMMDRGTVRNMQSFIPRIKFEKLAHLVGFIIMICHDARSRELKNKFAKCKENTIQYFWYQEKHPTPEPSLFRETHKSTNISTHK